MSEESLDCGDNSCGFAKDKGGMRTNGGCRCFSNAGFLRSPTAAAYQMLPEIIRLRDRVEELDDGSSGVAYQAQLQQENENLKEELKWRRGVHALTGEAGRLGIFLTKKEIECNKLKEALHAIVGTQEAHWARSGHDGSKYRQWLGYDSLDICVDERTFNLLVEFGMAKKEDVIK